MHKHYKVMDPHYKEFMGFSTLNGSGLIILLTKSSRDKATVNRYISAHKAKRISYRIYNVFPSWMTVSADPKSCYPCYINMSYNRFCLNRWVESAFKNTTTPSRWRKQRTGEFWQHSYLVFKYRKHSKTQMLLWAIKNLLFLKITGRIPWELTWIASKMREAAVNNQEKKIKIYCLSVLVGQIYPLK